MKLTPHEILYLLGFDIPEDGIEINPNDSYLHSESLRLLGKTMDVERIEDDDLINAQQVMASMVAAYRNIEATKADSNTPDRFRLLIKTNCKLTYKLRNEG